MFSTANKNYFFKIVWLFVIMSSYINRAISYKILGIFPYAGKSHFDVFEPMLKELASRGHDVTIIGHFPLEKPIPNYRDISLRGTSEILQNVVPVDFVEDSAMSRLFHVMELASFTDKACDAGLKSNQIQNFIQSKEKFDVVLTEFFTPNCFVGLLHYTGGALVGLTSNAVVPWVNDFVGTPDNPSYIPSLFVGYSDHMNFMERVQNTLMYVVAKVIYRYWMDKSANVIAKEDLNSTMPDLNDFIYNASLLLVNIHSSVQRPRPHVPAVIEVGGMHIGNQKQLPQNLEKWINESTDGVIYFSMGSMIKGHTFPVEKREMFVRAFARLKQRVLWKWENETLPNKPDNVMIQKWMPQFDILCHPNVKAFITHGGLLSTTEAVHCGVPAVVMPQFGDQYTNARALESSGGGIILHFSTITEEDVYNALKTVLDPSFNKQTKELSARFKDRPMPPLETAIYWIEYVARHKGAPHLRSAAVGMPYYQYLLLDVIAFLLFVILALSYVSYIVTRFVFRKLFKRQPKVKKQ